MCLMVQSHFLKKMDCEYIIGSFAAWGSGAAGGELAYI